MTNTVEIVQIVAGIATAVVAVVALVIAQRARSDDARRATQQRVDDERTRRIAALLEEVVKYTDAVAKMSGQWGTGALRDAAKLRIEAALALAGGASAWPQTDLLVRVPPESVADQSKASLLELTTVLNGHRHRR